MFEYNRITKEAVFPNGMHVPNFDVTNRDFVKKCVKVPFNVNDTVLYNNKLYLITNINHITGRCELKEYYSNVIISRLNYKMFNKAVLYYFINSSGEIHTSYVGKDVNADIWRQKTSNMFTTKEEATEYRDNILKKN